MSADLLLLALRAIDDADALPVLGDAVLEDGWWHEGVIELLGIKDLPLPKNYRRFRSLAAAPTHRWARAVHAALFFEGWAGRRGWPVAERARRPPPDIYALLRDMWSDAGISEMAYQESPLLGTLRKDRSVLVDALAREQDSLMAEIVRQHSKLLYASTPEETQRFGSVRTDAVERAVSGLKRSTDR